MSEKQEIINKTERPNSLEFRYGKTGTGVKLYFENAQDVLTQLRELADKSTEMHLHIAKIKENMGDEK